MRQILTLVAGLAVASAAIANDTTASTGAGGLVLERTDAIDMISEDLFISVDEIRIRYVFRNRTPSDVETIVGAINAPNRLAGRGAKCPKPLGHPGFDMHQTMGPSGQNGAEPDRAHPAQAETGPVAVGGKMGVEQRR